ncbi:hypothetical protein [uncultured Hymenobacter sp.]|uniref:hypothetical protein n=1 Tax=uncultured Hymenobacter sp. TaxID=170016 RepID=UPI0035C9469C
MEDESGPRVDLVGGSRFLSASRTVTTASNTAALADTFTTRVFAERQDDGAELNRLVIAVEYSPTPYPYVYPTTTAFNPNDIPKEPASIVYLDTTLTRQQRQSVAFQFTANTRTTSGREKWVFTAYDADNKKKERSFTLVLRNSDSLRVAAYHRYTILLPAPTTPYSRSSLALLPGLALPPNALRGRPENQELIDLAYLPLADGERALAAPNDAQLMRTNALFNASNWLKRRHTSLRGTDWDSARFANATTTEAFQNAFNDGQILPSGTRTEALRARGIGRVLAFKTDEGSARYGLIFIQSFLTAPTPAIKMQVRITK